MAKWFLGRITHAVRAHRDLQHTREKSDVRLCGKAGDDGRAFKTVQKASGGRFILNSTTYLDNVWNTFAFAARPYITPYNAQSCTFGGLGLGAGVLPGPMGLWSKVAHLGLGAGVLLGTMGLFQSCTFGAGVPLGPMGLW